MGPTTWAAWTTAGHGPRHGRHGAWTCPAGSRWPTGPRTATASPSTSCTSSWARRCPTGRPGWCSTWCCRVTWCSRRTPGVLPAATPGPSLEQDAGPDVARLDRLARLLAVAGAERLATRARDCRDSALARSDDRAAAATALLRAVARSRTLRLARPGPAHRRRPRRRRAPAPALHRRPAPGSARPRPAGPGRHRAGPGQRAARRRRAGPGHRAAAAEPAAAGGAPWLSCSRPCWRSPLLGTGMLAAATYDAGRRRQPRRRRAAGAETARLLVQRRRTTVGPDAAAVAARRRRAAGARAADGGAGARSAATSLADLPVGVVWFNALDVMLWVVVWMAGWGANSVWPLVGGVPLPRPRRSPTSSPLMFALTAPALAAGSLGVAGVVAAQQGLWFVVWMPVAAVGLPRLRRWASASGDRSRTRSAPTSRAASWPSRPGVDRLLLQAGRWALLVAGTAFAVPLFLGGGAGPLLPGGGPGRCSRRRRCWRWSCRCGDGCRCCAPTG